MPDWPAPDLLAVWQGSPRPPAAESRAEIAGRIALSRFREGLPVSDEVIEELFALADRNGEQRPGMFTEQEREEIGRDRQRVERAREALAGAEPVPSQIEICRLDGRRAVRVFLTGDLDFYRERLVQALGADRVVVMPARFSERQMVGFRDRILEASDELAGSGIFISRLNGGPDAFTVRYFAADFERAEETLRERFGEFLPAVPQRRAAGGVYGARVRRQRDRLGNDPGPSRRQDPDRGLRAVALHGHAEPAPR